MAIDVQQAAEALLRKRGIEFFSHPSGRGMTVAGAYMEPVTAIRYAAEVA